MFDITDREISTKPSLSYLESRGMTDVVIQLDQNSQHSIVLSPWDMAKLINKLTEALAPAVDWEMVTEPDQVHLGDDIRLVTREGYVDGAIASFENAAGEDGFLILEGGEEDGRGIPRFFEDADVQMVFKAV